MNGFDCSFWSVSWLSYSSFVFCILGVWGLPLAFCLTGQILSPGTPEAGPSVVPGWFSGCPGPLMAGRSPRSVPERR